VRVETMRAVDRAVGRPLAWFLTRWRRLRGDRAPRARADVRKVLFVKLSEMGAIALAAPAFREVAKVFPGAEPWILCFAENAGVARVVGIPPERQITVDSSSLSSVVTGLVSAIRRARREDFDVVVDLEYFSRVSALLSFLTAAPVRVGFHRFEAEGLYCGDLYTHRTTFNTYLHIAQSMVMLVRAAAADPAGEPLVKSAPPRMDELEFPEFQPTAEARQEVTALLTRAGVPAGAPFVIVNPNSSDLLPLRRWPEERFVALCHGLLQAVPDLRVVLSGAPHEEALGDRIVAAVREAGDDGRLVSVIGKTSMEDLLTLMSLSRVLVSADSGPPHFAIMTGTRVVTLFGPETPLLYGPVNDRNTAVTANLACSPCINAWNRRVSTCTENLCMTEISVGRVIGETLMQFQAEAE